jgi:hypothetical protein
LDAVEIDQGFFEELCKILSGKVFAIGPGGNTETVRNGQARPNQSGKPECLAADFVPAARPY